MAWLMFSVLLAAAKPPPNNSPPNNSPPSNSPPPPRPPLPRNSILDGRPSQSVWRQLQLEVDRVSGRIVDEPTYQLDHLQPPAPDQRFDRFMEERDRQMQRDERAPQRQKTGEQLSREELDRREYELFMNAGLSSMSLQAMTDEKALLNAKSIRDRELLAAQDQEAQALRQRPMDRQVIEKAYLMKAKEIRQTYETERQRILGYPPPAPTTQP